MRNKAERFRELHAEGIFIMPCAWDACSAKLFAASGFSAVGTTSGGVNWSAGRPDYIYSVPREEMLDSYGLIAQAVDLPVSGDLENGYGPTPDHVAETIRAAINRGMVGGSIEDQTPSAGPELFSLGDAVERVAAARAAADQSGIDFVLTARAESYFGAAEAPFNDAVRRANAYVEAGADCVFIPGPADIETISSLVTQIDAPLSVGIGTGGGSLSIEQLADVGVRRVSTGGAVPRLLSNALLQAASEMIEHGSFRFTNAAISDIALENLLTDLQPPVV